MGVKIAISSYSFYGLDSDDRATLPSVHEMIDHCVEFGVDGIEFLNEHLTRSGVTTAQDRRELQQYAAVRGIRPVMVAASNNPVQIDPAARAEDLTKLIEWIEWAADLGAPFVRAQGGRWHTTKDFQEMLQHGGEEPPAEGYTEDQGFEWAIESLKFAAWYASRKGVTLVLENHWGLTGTAAGCNRIHDGVSSPWLKYVLDTGNFFHRPDQYAEMQTFMSDLGLVHAKVYKGGSRIGVPDLDYARIGQMLRDANYTGYASIEFEGNAPTREGIEDGIATLREHLV